MPTFEKVYNPLYFIQTSTRGLRDEFKSYLNLVEDSETELKSAAESEKSEQVTTRLANAKAILDQANATLTDTIRISKILIDLYSSVLKKRPDFKAVELAIGDSLFKKASLIMEDILKLENVEKRKFFLAFSKRPPEIISLFQAYHEKNPLSARVVVLVDKSTNTD